MPKITLYAQRKSSLAGAGVRKRYRGSGAYTGGAPMQVVTTGLAPLRTGGFFGGRRNLQEKKTVDVDPTTVEATSTPTITLLNGIATGTDFTDRIGRRVTMKSLFIRMAMYPVDTITDNSVNRIMIIYDKQTNGAAPAITDILKSSNPVSHLNLNNRDRFVVLMDKFIAMGLTSNVATQSNSNAPNIKQFTRYIPLSRRANEVLFSGTGATVGSIQTGSVYLVILSNVTTTNGVTCNYATRIRYTDA